MQATDWIATARRAACLAMTVQRLVLWAMASQPHELIGFMESIY